MPTPRPTPGGEPQYLTRAEAAALETGAIALTADLTSIGLSHMQEFKESLDTNDLIQFARDAGLPVRAAYDAYVKDRRTTRQQQEHQDALARAKEEGRQEALREQSPTPYPSPTQANATLSRINQPVDQAEFGVSAAVREYQSLQQGGR